MKLSKERLQLAKLQDIAVSVAATLKSDIDQHANEPRIRALLGSSLAQVLRSWDTLCDRERIAKGKPLPGSLRQDTRPSKVARTRAAALSPEARAKLLELTQPAEIEPEPERESGTGTG